MELKFDDPHRVFPLLLRFLYDGRVALTLDNAVPLLCQSDYYGVDELSRQCTAYIKRKLRRDTVLSVLHDAIAVRRPLSLLHSC